MCGRFLLDTSWAELRDYFELIRPEPDAQPEIAPRYNIAPTTPIVVVRRGDDGAREAIHTRWGLIPSWVKDPKAFTLLINARAETAASKPSFRNAFRRRRVLVPASGFYEWRRLGKGPDGKQRRQAYAVLPPGNAPVAFAGLMETWHSPDGSQTDTACILTTDATDTFRPIHDRLPMIVEPRHFERWLDTTDHEPDDVSDLLHAPGDGWWRPVPVSPRVNKVGNDGPQNLEEVEPVAALPGPGDASGQGGLFDA